MLKPFEVAALLGVTTQRVYKMCRDGELPFIRLGTNRIRFPRPQWDAWLERQGRMAEEQRWGRERLSSLAEKGDS